MLTEWIRVLFSDNGTLTDFSLESQNKTDTFGFEAVALEDHLYIAQYFPFNNFFVNVGTVNSNNATPTIEYWGGNAWETAVDVIDATKSSGAMLAKDGTIQFSPQDDEPWEIIQDTTDAGEPAELASITRYNLYWLRMKPSADLSAGTTINQITYAFTTNEMLAAISPEIDEYQTAWESGKTNWDEQIQIASKTIVLDLRAKGLVASYGQVLRFDDVFLAGAYMTLHLIYSGLGDNFKDKAADAHVKYTHYINLRRFTFDTNRDALVSRGEIQNRVGQGVR